MFVNRMPRYEILCEDAIATLDRGWRRIVTEIGVEFLLPEAVELFAAEGQRTEGDMVFLDPDFVLEQIAKAPREFDVQARNPANGFTSAATTWSSPRSTARPSCARATCAATRRWPTSSASSGSRSPSPQLDTAGGTICEPNDVPLDSRHLDMVFALQTLSDKPYMGSVTSGPNAEDTIAMTAMLFGGRAAIEQTPAALVS